MKTQLLQRISLDSNSIFLVEAAVTAMLLLIPLAAMQFTDEVMWDLTDFVVMGLMLFSSGSVFVLVARKLPARFRFWTAAVFLVVFLWVWAELAVGIFTNVGS